MCIGGRAEGGYRDMCSPVFLNYTVGSVLIHETEIRANDRTILQLFWTDDAY